MRSKPDQAGAERATPPGSTGDGDEKNDSPKQLALGLFFGIIFGFLLQKGGVAKYDVLLGVLLLTDFTVMKIMLTAILVGMIGIFAMHALGLVKLHLKPTKYAANVIGGLVFGAGFALIGYCPGTGAAALGQGNLDAVAGIAGLLVGSYLFAELSGKLGKNVLARGDRGCIQLPDLIGVRTMPFLILFAPLLGVALWLLYLYFP